MSEVNAQSFGSYARRCWMVFAAVASATLVMVAASYAPIASRNIAMAMVLGVACFNAFMVGGYLMHLFSERKVIYALLAFTSLFFVALVWLSWWAAGDKPALMH